MKVPRVRTTLATRSAVSRRHALDGLAQARLIVQGRPTARSWIRSRRSRTRSETVCPRSLSRAWSRPLGGRSPGSCTSCSGPA